MGDKRKPYALIAEADPARAARYMGFVVELGLEPNHARDGDTAKNTLRTRGAPALVITELSLPRSDGFALLTDLRSRCSPEQTPAVVISGFLELRTRAWNEREQLGIIEVLSTSSPPESIFNALKRAVSVARTPRAPSQPPMAMADQPRVDHVRLAKIQLHIADPNVASAALSNLAQEIAEAFHVPLAMVWVRDPIWFSGRSGPDSDPLHRLSFEELLEAQSIAAPHGGAPELAADTAVNRTRMGHPLVQRGLVRSLAAVPLSSSSGAQLGVLCLMHQRRMALSHEHLDALVALARRLSGEIEVREAIRRNESERQRLAAINTNAAESLIELEAMLDELESGVLLLDAERRISFANRAIAEQLGRPLDRIVGASFEEFHQTNARLFDDPTDYLQRIHILPDGPFVLREELEQQRPTRRVMRWVMRPVQRSGGQAQLIVTTDITAEIDLSAAQERLARTDYLTGLANRTAAEEAISREMARARREKVPLALALVDLDGFRRVNEAHGTATGDSVLKSMGLLLEATLRGGDLAARWGGEEFLLLLPGVEQAGARVVAERVRKEVEELIISGVQPVTVSVGVADVMGDEPPASAIARATGRLAFAKSEGGNRVR